MTDSTLMGLWSADRRYGPGSMSSEILVFLADHRGFWRYANPGSAYAEAFLWSLNEDGSLSISGTTSFEVEYVDDGERITQEPGHLRFERLKCRIEREATPRGEMLDVLTIGDERGQWRASLLGEFGLLSWKFALVRRDVEDCRAAYMY